MNILDALRNAIDFSRRDIIDIVKNRTEINDAIKGIDSIVENDYRYSRAEKTSEYATKRSALQTSVKNNTKAIKVAVQSSQDRQYTEVEKLAVEFMKTMQAESDRKFDAWVNSTDNFKSVSNDYHNSIKDVADHDWGESRIMARIDRAIASKNTIPNYQPTPYVEAKVELANALNNREGRILTAVANTKEVEQAFAHINNASQKINDPTPPELDTVTGKQLAKAFEAKFMALQQQVNDLTLKNAKLNNITFIQNTAKNNLTNGDYKRLHDEARKCKENMDSAGFNERVQMIKMLDAKFITHPAIKELAIEMKTLEDKFNTVIVKNNNASALIKNTMSGIKIEKNKLKSLDDFAFKIETKNLSKLISSESYQTQVKQAHKQIAKSASLSM